MNQVFPSSKSLIVADSKLRGRAPVVSISMSLIDGLRLMAPNIDREAWGPTHIKENSHVVMEPCQELLVGLLIRFGHRLVVKIAAVIV